MYDLYKLETVSNIKAIYFLRFDRNYWKNMNKLKVLSAHWKVLKLTSPQIFLCPVKMNPSEILLFGRPLYLQSTGKWD